MTLLEFENIGFRKFPEYLELSLAGRSWEMKKVTVAWETVLKSPEPEIPNKSEDQLI